MVDDRQVLFDYYTKKLEHIGTDSNSCDMLNIMSNSYVNSFPQEINRSFSNEAVLSNKFNVLFVDTIPLITSYPSVLNTQTSSQIHISYEQPGDLGVNDFVPIMKESHLSELCPTSPSVIFSHDSKPSEWDFNSMKNEVSSEFKYTCLNLNKRDIPLKVEQSFICNDRNNIKSCNSNAYSHDNELTKRDSYLNETNFGNILHEPNSLPLNLFKSSNRVSNNSTEIGMNYSSSNPIPMTDVPNNILNKDINVSDSFNLYNLQLPYTFPFDTNTFGRMDKPVSCLEVDMKLSVTSDETNSISQDKVSSSFQHAQFPNRPEKNIDQKSLNIQSQSKRDTDKTTNKSYNAWGKKKKILKETKHCFHTDFRYNRIQELNGKAYPENGYIFESISSEPNICPLLYPAESKSVKVAQLFKENPVNNIHFYGIQQVRNALPDLKTKTTKPVSKKSSSLEDRNYKALQKSTRADKRMSAQGKDNKPKSKPGKMLSNIPKQNNRFSFPCKLLAENVHGVQRIKAKRKRYVKRRNNLNALELRNFQSVSKTRISPKDQSVSDKNIPTDELFDNVKHEKINPDEKLLNIRHVSRHKIFKAAFSASKMDTSSKAYANSEKCKSNRTTNFKQPAKTLETVSTKVCKKKLKTYHKTCSIDCQLNEKNNTDNHAYDYDIYNKSDGSIDFLKGYAECFNCKHIKNASPYTVTSLSSDNDLIKNYTLPNHSFNILDNINSDGFEVQEANDDSELTNIIQSSLIYDGNVNFDLVSNNNRYYKPVCMMTDSSFNSDKEVNDCFTIPTPTIQTSSIENESDFVITDVFSLSDFWDSISSEVPYIENNCWQLSS